jgi:hypothetical protein
MAVASMICQQLSAQLATFLFGSRQREILRAFAPDPE